VKEGVWRYSIEDGQERVRSGVLLLPRDGFYFHLMNSGRPAWAEAASFAALWVGVSWAAIGATAVISAYANEGGAPPSVPKPVVAMIPAGVVLGVAGLVLRAVVHEPVLVPAPPVAPAPPAVATGMVPLAPEGLNVGPFAQPEREAPSAAKYLRDGFMFSARGTALLGAGLFSGAAQYAGGFAAEVTGRYAWNILKTHDKIDTEYSSVGLIADYSNLNFDTPGLFSAGIIWGGPKSTWAVMYAVNAQDTSVPAFVAYTSFTISDYLSAQLRYTEVGLSQFILTAGLGYEYMLF
jgi:hypothetical protein